jgi:hypothetical protein
LAKEHGSTAIEVNCNCAKQEEWAKNRQSADAANQIKKAFAQFPKALRNAAMTLA